ncbi:hypothetical protein [Nocardioides sp. SR21]|uniref:hypothetical protein n=1 Tax=Nocardioides sp. SR21 TaxID=2919501 RepID=UPI001FAA4099|nr:hypothetical protein [Nocardioides sp. SR21]
MAPPPALALRIVSRYDDVSRRVDVEITGSRGVLHEDGRATEFETARLWPTVRALLPPLDQLRADPPAHRSPTPDRAPGPDWATECRAMVAIATGTDARPVVRTWFATDDELWSAEVGSVRLARPGDLADLLVWDVTGALETLVGQAVP